MNLSSEARTAEGSFIASHHVQRVSLGILIGSAELAAPYSIAIDVADLGHISDRDPFRAAAAREKALFIKDSGDALLLQDTPCGFYDPAARQIDGILVVPGHGFAIVDTGFGLHALDCDIPALGNVLPDV